MYKAPIPALLSIEPSWFLEFYRMIARFSECQALFISFL